MLGFEMGKDYFEERMDYLTGFNLKGRTNMYFKNMISKWESLDFPLKISKFNDLFSNIKISLISWYDDPRPPVKHLGLCKGPSYVSVRGVKCTFSDIEAFHIEKLLLQTFKDGKDYLLDRRSSKVYNVILSSGK